MCVKFQLSVSENSRDIKGIVLSAGSICLQTREWQFDPDSASQRQFPLLLPMAAIKTLFGLGLSTKTECLVLVFKCLVLVLSIFQGSTSSQSMKFKLRSRETFSTRPRTMCFLWGPGESRHAAIKGAMKSCLDESRDKAYKFWGNITAWQYMRS